MTATDGAGEWNTGGLAEPFVPPLRWRRVFPGHERELSVLRKWLSSLLPECPERDDALVVANELASNALQHTASGHGAWFAVEVTSYGSVVKVAVADCGGAAEPHVIEDPGGERGRGLLLVRELSVRTGFVGDRRGRLVWAEVPWGDVAAAESASPQAGYEAAIRDGEAALARRFAGVPAWFGWSTLRWWAVAGSHGLVSAPTAPELAGLLYRLLNASGHAHATVGERPSRSVVGEPASHTRRRPGAGRRDMIGRRAGAGSTGYRDGGVGRRGPSSDLAPGRVPVASLVCA
jgi:serine/threonine-protein kinase RsbW